MNDFRVLPKFKPESICYNVERGTFKRDRHKEYQFDTLKESSSVIFAAYRILVGLSFERNSWISQFSQQE